MGPAWKEWIVACSAALLAGTAVGAAQADLRQRPPAPVQDIAGTHGSAPGQLPPPQEGGPAAPAATRAAAAQPQAQRLSAAARPRTTPTAGQQADARRDGKGGKGGKKGHDG
jgi:hypothetical protein